MEKYDILECLSSAAQCDTLLVKEKAGGKKAVAKCYSKDSILFETTEPEQLKAVKGENLSCYIEEYKNAEYRCILREYIEGLSLDVYNRTVSLTDAFAAPEQYGFMQTDVRSDIYSFGVVLAWMLTGRVKPIQKPQTKLEEIAAKCCEFSPEKRYQNDDELLKQLRRAAPEGRARSQKRRKITAYLVVILAAVLTVTGILFRQSLRNSGVRFREPLLEEAVRAVLDKPAGSITDTDLDNVTEIYIQGESIYTSRDEFYAEGQGRKGRHYLPESGGMCD